MSHAWTCVLAAASATTSTLTVRVEPELFVSVTLTLEAAAGAAVGRAASSVPLGTPTGLGDALRANGAGAARPCAGPIGMTIAAIATAINNLNKRENDETLLFDIHPPRGFVAQVATRSRVFPTAEARSAKAARADTSLYGAK